MLFASLIHLRPPHNMGGGTHFSGGTNSDSGGTFAPPFKLLKYALLKGVAGEAMLAKLVKVDVRLCETPNDTDEETRTNKVKFTITPYLSLVCACVSGMGSKEKFLLHPEIIAELKAIPQVIIKREEEVQANVITRAQRLQKEREE